MRYQSDKTHVKSRVVLESHLFSFLQEGRKTVSYASGTQRITPASFFFLPAGNCLMTEKVADQGRYSSLLLSVSTQALSRFFQQHPFPTPADTKKIQTQDKTPIAIAKDPYIENLITGLELMCKNNIQKNQALYAVKFEELMLYLLDKDPGLIPYFKGLYHEAGEDVQIRKIVSTSLDSSVTVEELAFLCHMSLSTFKRKFSKTYGVPPKQWFLKVRMQKAAELLSDKSVKASEIYDQFGYENLSSFVQSFKQVHGTTPKQFQLRS